MGLLIELIKTIAEAIEEGRGNQRPRQLPPTALPPAEDEDEDAVDSEADREEPEDLKAKQRLHQKHVEVQRARAEAEARAKVAARRAATAESERVVPRQVAGGERLARLLRQPQTLRDLVMLKEILDRPLALRRERR